MTGPSRRSVLVLGTRGSKLALHQSQWVANEVMRVAPEVTVTLTQIRTSGDKIQDVPLAKIGGKGLFVKEIEEALLADEIDFAVHSMKDVPTALPDGLAITCVPHREDPRDVLLTRNGMPFAQLPQRARIGTSSLRRQAQLLQQRPDCEILMLRGNLDTRIRKLQEGVYDAIVLAAAGLRRLGWTEHITEYLSTDLCLPAIGQGALGIESRLNDPFVTEILARLEDAPTRVAVTAERALLHRLEGGCQVPIAAHAVIEKDQVHLRGLVASVDGKQIIRGDIRGTIADAESLGLQLGDRLLSQGAREILRAIYTPE